MGGQYKSYRAHELGAGLIRNALFDLDIAANQIEKVYMGQVLFFTLISCYTRSLFY